MLCKENKKKQVVAFFKDIKSKIEKNNPGFGVHIQTIKLPKGAGKGAGLKMVQQLAKKLGAKPTQVKHFDAKTQEKVRQNMEAWVKDQTMIQIRNKLEFHLKDIARELKQNKLLQQQFHSLTPVFFALAKNLYLFRTKKITRAKYIHDIARFTDFLRSRTR